MPKYSKDIHVLVKAAEEAGWKKRQSAGRHPVLYPSDKSHSPIPVPVSLSDHRGYKNFRSRLRQAGLEV